MSERMKRNRLIALDFLLNLVSLRAVHLNVRFVRFVRYGRFKFLTKFGAMEGNHLKESNISYLRARDPSILTFNRHHLSEVRTNLHEEFCNDNHQQEQVRKLLFLNFPPRFG
jgi:hypothetical protein